MRVRETFSQRNPRCEEFAGLVRSGLARLKDAENAANSLDSRFDLAYSAAHALCLAALRHHGFRPSKRYIVFQVLPDTLGLGPEVWRVLSKCHDMRNRTEYEGAIDVMTGSCRSDRRLASSASRSDSLGGESDAPPVMPPWFLPGAEAVWQRIAETERGLRGVVREVYVARFGDSAALRIEGAVPEGERQTLTRNLARRPAGADPLSIVDYLYLGQLPNILFAPDVQQEARTRFTSAQTRSSDSWRHALRSHLSVTR